MRFGEEPLSLELQATVDAARDCGFAAISANDHLVFQTPWLDGLTALASVIEAVGGMSWPPRSRSSSCAVPSTSRRRSRRSTCSRRAG